MIPYSTQKVTLRDRINVFRALGSPFLTQGPEVARFENAICDLTEAKYGIAANSATSALHLACLALKLGRGDIMWTTPISFVASANCALYTGAKVEFVDIDSGTWNISVQRLKEKLVSAKAQNALPKVLTVVHFAGEPAEMSKIWALSQEYGFRIIEDASHALGSKLGQMPVGCGKWSAITVFSFHAVKNITTGEGGMAVTNSLELAESMRLNRSHGITREEHRFTSYDKVASSWYYEQQSLGFNYRLTDFQAALGTSQLKYLERYNRIRRTIMKTYRRELAGFEGIRFQECREENTSAQHLCVVRLSPTIRNKVHHIMQLNGIATNLHYIPIYRHPFHFKSDAAALSAAESYADSALSLPCHPGLTNRQVVKISKLLRDTILALEPPSAVD